MRAHGDPVVLSDARPASRSRFVSDAHDGSGNNATTSLVLGCLTLVHVIAPRREVPDCESTMLVEM